MAIDSTMFAATVPAGTYAVGARVPLRVVRGPQVVRDGYGKAFFKRFFTTKTDGTLGWAVYLKNSNWVDSLSNIAVNPNAFETILDGDSAAIQEGHNADLIANSGWECYAVCIEGGTISAASDIIALLDIDYPSVLAVENPRRMDGEPVTLDETFTISPTAAGAVATAPVWNTFNRDIFKAGYKYLLTEAAAHIPAGTIGFISISGAAGQAGLERIIPTRGSTGGSRYPILYSTPLVKGPMNINVLAVGPAAPVNSYTYFDFVKKKL